MPTATDANLIATANGQGVSAVASNRREVYQCAREITVIAADPNSHFEYNEYLDLVGDFDYLMEIPGQRSIGLLIDPNNKGINEIFMPRFSDEPIASLLPGANVTKEILSDIAFSWIVIHTVIMRVRKLDDGKFQCQKLAPMPGGGVYWNNFTSSRSINYIKGKIQDLTVNYNVLVDYYI
jgi:hypothetical protein